MGKFQRKSDQKKNKKVQKSRKDIRKENRKLKKVHRHEFSSKGKKNGGRFVRTPKDIDSSPTVKKQVVDNPPKTDKCSQVDKVALEQQKQRKREEALKKEMDKRRKQQLLKANEIEDQGIKKLEKQLKLNRNKKKGGIPKSFASDGLDYVLELFDSDKLSAAASAEEKLALTNEDDFNEDYDIAMGKSVAKKSKKVAKNTEESESDTDLSDVDSEFGDRSLNADEEGIESDEDVSDNSEEGINYDGIDSDNSEGEGSYEEDDDEFNLSLNSEASDSCDDDNIDMDDEVANAYLGLGEFPDGIFRPENLSPVFEETSTDLEDYDNGVNIDKKLQLKYNYLNSELNTSCDESIDGMSDCEITPTKNVSGKRKADTDGNNKKKLKRMELNESSSQDSNESEEDTPFSDNDESLEDANLSENADNSKKHSDNWEDIYGRTRDKDGNIVKETVGKYIPPQARAKLVAAAPTEKMLRMKRQIKGLLNKVTENNMHSIASEIDGIFMSNSRHETNDALASLSIEALVNINMTPDLMIAHHTMLVAILHANVGSEVGAYYLQTAIKKFETLLAENQPVHNKSLDNVVSILSNLYNFKIYSSALLLDILKKLSSKISEKNLELVLVVLRVSGFFLRKDDPSALKDCIISLQRLGNEAPAEITNNSRLKFMMDVLFAIKNNNVSKIPSYDPAPLEHLRKTLRGLLRKGNYVQPINVSYDDLLNADERGRWWIIGSAWSGDQMDEKKDATNPSTAYSQELLELAKKQRMNTDIRRNIFCAIMSAEDNTDALEKVLNLGLKGIQERDIAYVLLNCCLQETPYNPFYAALADKFCGIDRKYQMPLQCAIWGKLRDLESLKSEQSINLAKFLTYLIAKKGLPISVLKVIEFSELQKLEFKLVRRILLGIFLNYNNEEIKEVFQRATGPKLKLFRQSLRLFLQHFLLGAKNNEKDDLINKINIVDSILMIGDSNAQY